MRRPSATTRHAAWLLSPFFAFFVVFWVVPLFGGLRMALYSNELYEIGRAHV